MLGSDIQHYRIHNDSKVSYEQSASEWADKIAKFTKAKSIRIDGETRDISDTLSNKWKESCDLNDLNKLKIELPSKGDLRHFTNCLQLKRIQFKYHEKKTKLTSMSDLLLLKTAFRKWDIKEIKDAEGHIIAVKLSKNDTKKTFCDRFWENFSLKTY